MAEDMEMFLEQVIKKTNPEEYIKILEQDREDFAEEINRLNNTIDELTEEYINYMTKQDFAKKCNISRPYLDKLLKKMNRKEIYEFCKIRNKLKGDNK